MKSIEKLDVMMYIVERSLFLPYIWGGQTPLLGFDCSGLVVECLRSIGVIHSKSDFTANGLFKLCEQYVKSQDPQRGDLIFWYIGDKGEKELRIKHVEICFSPGLSIGASGGNSQTRTLTNAAQHDAYVKIRPFKPRGTNILYVDIYKVIENITDAKA